MIIVFTAVKKFKRLINKNQSETEDQKVGVIDPLIDYYSKRVNYSNEDDLRHYAENRANHIQRMKKLSFLEGKHQTNQYEGVIYEENMMVKSELQVHNMSEIQNEYYIFTSKKLINQLLIRTNSIIKQKRKEMNQEEANEILKIIDEICDLHIFQFKTKTSISEFVMQDMIKIIHNMLKNGIHMDINLPISIKNVDFNEYLHKDQKNIKYEKTEIRDIISQEDVIDSIKKAIWYIVKLKISSERIDNSNLVNIMNVS